MVRPYIKHHLTVRLVQVRSAAGPAPRAREMPFTERKDLFFVSLVAYTIAPVGFTLLCFLLYGYIRNASASAERAFLKDWGSLRELIQGPPKGPEKGTPPTVVLHGLLPHEQFRHALQIHGCFRISSWAVMATFRNDQH